MFALYKNNLEWYGIYHDWWSCHLISLDRIDPQAVRNSFRKCDVPVDDYLQPGDKEEEIAAAIIIYSAIKDLN